MPIEDIYFIRVKAKKMEKTTGMTDEELALAYAAGSNKAFDELLLRHQDKLFAYILFVVREREVANDIFQDTFVKVIVKLQQQKYVSNGKFGAWIMRIAHNAIMDWYREKKSSQLVEPTPDNNLSAINPRNMMDDNRESRFVNEQILDDVRRMMDSLPAPQREVVYMRFYQEMSFKEIAELTGVSINTSLGRMRYAVINMRRMAREHDMALQFE